MKPEEFICPECGSREVSKTVFVTTVPVPEDPWSEVLQRLTCGQCESVIPAHLGQRWDNLSVEAAQKEWREIYRPKQEEEQTFEENHADSDSDRRLDMNSAKKKRVPPGTYFWTLICIVLLSLVVGFIMAAFDRGDNLEMLRGKRETNGVPAK